MDTRGRRMWADIVVIVASVSTLGQAIWGPALLTQQSQDRGTSFSWVISIIAGAVAMFGLVLSQRRVGLGQALVAVAGVVLLVGPFTYQRMAPLPMSFAVIAGVLLLGAAKFVGPMPVSSAQRDVEPRQPAR
jgi:hypothetical protein